MSLHPFPPTTLPLCIASGVGVVERSASDRLIPRKRCLACSQTANIPRAICLSKRHARSIRGSHENFLDLAERRSYEPKRTGARGAPCPSKWQTFATKEISLLAGSRSIYLARLLDCSPGCFVSDALRHPAFRARHCSVSAARRSDPLSPVGAGGQRGSAGPAKACL